MDQLAQKTFQGLHDKVDAVLDLIENDVHLTLASGRQRGADDDEEEEVQEVQEERLNREELEAKVKELKTRHEELLGSIAVVGLGNGEVLTGVSGTNARLEFP